MNKIILKNFAIDSRNKLIQDIKSKAAMIGIREEGIVKPLSESTSDMLIFDIGAVDTYIINGEEVKKYYKLKSELEKRTENDDYTTAYTTLIEEVAYTWFNRLIAIRFMEVNNYMPDKMRVLSSGRQGVNEPEFVTNYRDTSLNFTDRELEQLSDWKMDASAQSMERVFHLLFIKECNALNENLPELFEKTDDYAELLLTISYNDPEGVLYKLVHDIPEDYFDVETDDGNGQVEIIGWMYQYYNSEKKDEVFGRPKSQKIPKEDIPAATQLFTPDWIVRYMVENSLGRLWIEKLLASGEDRSEKEIAEDFGWKYYIPEAEQEVEVKEKLIEIRNDRKDLKLEEITFIDPAMGSFHIGVYAFDIFMQLYESQGYTSRDAAKSIIENNLYGIDIDKRAYQLSYFACMMKGRQYNRRILNGETKTNLYTIIESNDINRNHLDYLGNNIEDKKEWNLVKKDIIEILDLFMDAKEYGSILKINYEYNFKNMKDFISNTKEDTQVAFETVGIEETQNNIIYILKIVEILADKYDVVSTNPPYLGSNGMNNSLRKYVNKNYTDSKSDLFAVFMEKCKQMTKSYRYYAMITQHVWMFLSSFEKLRLKILQLDIINMAHLGTRAFEEISGEIVQTAAFIICKRENIGRIGTYVRLTDYNDASLKESEFFNRINMYHCNSRNFLYIPTNPISYWVSQRNYQIFRENEFLSNFGNTKKGVLTGNDKKYVRHWFEISFVKMGLGMKNHDDMVVHNFKWIPATGGGTNRKWYGNFEKVVNMENDAYEIRYNNSNNFRLRESKYYFKECSTWSEVSGTGLSMRFVPQGILFGNSGPVCFWENNIWYWIALLNSKIAMSFLEFLSPTLTFGPEQLNRIPCILDNTIQTNGISKKNILISKIDWDSFETSWDFKTHPLLSENKQQNKLINIEKCYNNWKKFTNNNFTQLKENEEELNRIFIEIYGLQDELTPEVSDKDITITKIFDYKDEIYDDIKGNRYILTKEDVIKSFISYAVGCMFGRYSLDKEGLAYAGGDWDPSKYENFLPTKDNIILITDEEYFQDDIVNRFVEFVRVTYGEETLDENLQFIADSLGGKAEPKEVIRNYFIKDFYKDHVKTYKKRPIYWLYDSGAGKTKRNQEDGFKALVYMHRYDEDTTGKLRIDYLHKVQKAYERRVENLKYDILNNKNPREVAASEKELIKLTKQIKETKDYDEKIGHLAVERIAIDLDDGVKVNYEKVQTDNEGKKLKILAKI